MICMTDSSPLLITHKSIAWFAYSEDYVSIYSRFTLSLKRKTAKNFLDFNIGQVLNVNNIFQTSTNNIFKPSTLTGIWTSSICNR